MTAIIYDKQSIDQVISLCHNTVLDLNENRITDAEKLRVAENTLRIIRGRIEGQGIPL